MTADVLVSHELKSLREELSASKKERAAAASAAVDVATPSAAGPIEETLEEQVVGEQLRQFADEVKTLFEEAEKSISTHPAQSVVGALLVGILIGRLLGRR